MHILFLWYCPSSSLSTLEGSAVDQPLVKRHDFFLLEVAHRPMLLTGISFPAIVPVLIQAESTAISKETRKVLPQ